MTRISECARSRRLVVVIVLIAGLESVAVLALAGQTQEASILGQVTDESGAVLPGVTVTVTSPALQVKQMVDVTDARGEYRVTPLPLGVYAVEFTLPGFQTLRRDTLRLTAGFVAKVDVVLKVGELTETISVSGQSPVVDVKTTATSTVLTREVLDILPTGRNGIVGFLSLAPSARGVHDFGGFIDNPVYHVFGRDNNAWVLIDGVAAGSISEQKNGGNNFFDSEAVEEVSVQTVGSGAESPTSGIQMNIITKSGGNDFHGGGSVYQFGQWMQSNNIDARLAAQGFTVNKVRERWDRSGALGGRIVLNKLWFYQSVRVRKDVAPLLGVFTQDGSPAGRPLRQAGLAGKITYQLNPSQKLIAAYQRNKNDDYAGSDINQFYSWDSRVSEGPVTLNLRKLEWQIAKGNKVVSLLVGSWTAPAGPYTGFTDQPSTFDQVTSRVSGLGPKVGAVVYNNQLGRYSSKGTMDWYKAGLFLGNHDFKTGFDYSSARGSKGTVDRGPAGNYQLIFRSGVPFTISARNNPVTPQSRLNYLAIFLQDSWTINRRLTLNLGVRYAHDNAFLPKQCRETAPPPFQDLYPAQCYPKFQFKIWNPVVPRLHAAYDLTGDGKTVIKGGWGRFATMYGSLEVELANENTDLATVFRWNDLNGDKLFQPGEANLDPNGPDFVSKETPSNATMLGLVQNPNLKEFGSDEISLSLERELMPNFSIRVSGIYSHDINTGRLENTLRPYDTYNIPITNPDPGPDGRVGTADDPGTVITYYDYPASLSGAAFQRPRFINDAKSNAHYTSVQIAASKRFSNRWQLMASYSATKLHVPYTPDLTGGKAVIVTTYNPNAEINAANNTWEWQTRLSGSYLFPADIQASANFLNQSGDPWARTVSLTGGKQIPSITVRAEPIGTRRLPSLSLLTLGAEKSFRLKRGHRVGVRAQVYNALNVNTVLGATSSSRLVLKLNPLSGPNFGKPTEIARPRIGEFALTYAF